MFNSAIPVISALAEQREIRENINRNFHKKIQQLIKRYLNGDAEDRSIIIDDVIKEMLNLKGKYSQNIVSSMSELVLKLDNEELSKICDWKDNKNNNIPAILSSHYYLRSAKDRCELINKALNKLMDCGQYPSNYKAKWLAMSVNTGNVDFIDLLLTDKDGLGLNEIKKAYELANKYTERATGFAHFKDSLSAYYPFVKEHILIKEKLASKVKDLEKRVEICKVLLNIYWYNTNEDHIHFEAMDIDDKGDRDLTGCAIL